MATDMVKVAYVCGPLTELSPEVQQTVKKFYSDIADVCTKILGVRAFVPHEHFDPIKHAGFSPEEVDRAERDQVCNKTSVLIVVTSSGPSWGGGIEVEMAREAGVPVIILCLNDKKVSRLLRGNPAVILQIGYDDPKDALKKLGDNLLCAATVGDF